MSAQTNLPSLADPAQITSLADPTPALAQVTSRFLASSQQNLAGQVGSSLSVPVLQGVKNRLESLAQALNSFTWPTGTPAWFQARAASSLDGQAQGLFTATVRSTQDSSPLVKVISAGFQANQVTGISPGTYGFNLSLGNYTEGLAVTVNQGDTWATVLSGVQNAVNNASLPVRADIVQNLSAFANNPDMAGVGSVLTLSVNPDLPDQDLRLADTSGHLLSQLRLSATSNPIGPAQEGQYWITGVQLAQPTSYTSEAVDPGAETSLSLGRHDLAFSLGNGAQTSSYISKAFDPTQATTLAPGNYSFTSTYGQETRAHQITIGQGWTCGDVLRAVAADISGQYASVNPSTYSPSTTCPQPGVTAQVDAWPIPSATQQGVNTNGQSLTITGAAGQNFALTDGHGGLLATLGLTTKLTGTAISFNVTAGAQTPINTWQEVMQSMTVAINGAQSSFTAQVTQTQVPSFAVPGMILAQNAVALSLVQQDREIGQNLNLSDGASGVLAAMNITAKQTPGQDGVITANGRTQVSANNTFSLDRGRVLVQLENTFSQALPLQVTSGMDEMENSLGGITGAYNNLTSYIQANSDILNPGLSQTLDAPLRDQAQNLNWLGISASGKKGLLWTNLDRFWSAASAQPDRAQAALVGQANGLIPAWQGTVNNLLQSDPQTWLAPQSGFQANQPVLTSEFELEQKHRLVNLLG